MKLNEEIVAIQDMAKKFVQKEILPRVEEDEREHRFQGDIVKKMGDLGFFGCPIPETYGGSSLGFLAHAVVTEEMLCLKSGSPGSMRRPKPWYDGCPKTNPRPCDAPR